MDQIVNNIQFVWNLTCMLKHEKICNLTVRFSKKCNYISFFSGSYNLKVHLHLDLAKIKILSCIKKNHKKKVCS